MVSFIKLALGALTLSGITLARPYPPFDRLHMRVTRFYTNNCSPGTNYDRLDSMGPLIKEGNCHHFPDERPFNSIKWWIFLETRQFLADYGYCGLKIYRDWECTGDAMAVVPDVNDYHGFDNCGNYNQTFGTPFEGGVGVRLICKDQPWGRNVEWP